MSLNQQEQFFAEFSDLPKPLKQEVIDFFYFIKSRYSAHQNEDINSSQMLDFLSQSSSFKFLEQEKDLYTLSDAEEVYY